MNDSPVAIITGASRGIGAATAEQFSRSGYRVTLAARTRAGLEETADRVRRVGPESLIVDGDLADLQYAESIVRRTADQFGRVDVLVNNAAWRELVTMRNITPESWERTLRVSLTAPAFLSRWAAELMSQQGGGAIINVSSVQSQRAPGFSPAYVACKGAIDALTRELSVLYGPSGIRVVTVSPGAIDTEMSREITAADQDDVSTSVREQTEDCISLRRWGTTAEVARAIVWLAGHEASYITGTSIHVDGGLSSQFASYTLNRTIVPDEFK